MTRLTDNPSLESFTELLHLGIDNRLELEGLGSAIYGFSEGLGAFFVDERLLGGLLGLV